MTGRELLDELAEQESRLVFDHFDEDTAWALGVALRRPPWPLRQRQQPWRTSPLRALDMPLFHLAIHPGHEGKRRGSGPRICGTGIFGLVDAFGQI